MLRVQDELDRSTWSVVTVSVVVISAGASLVVSAASSVAMLELPPGQMPLHLISGALAVRYTLAFGGAYQGKITQK